MEDGAQCQHEREQAQQRAGLTCGEAQPTRGVDGPCWLRGFRCGAITTGLGRHDTAVVHSSGGPWRRSCTPLRPPTKYLDGRGEYFFPACTFCSVVVVGQTDRRGILRSPRRAAIVRYAVIGHHLITEETRTTLLLQFCSVGVCLAYVLPDVRYLYAQSFPYRFLCVPPFSIS